MLCFIFSCKKIDKIVFFVLTGDKNYGRFIIVNELLSYYLTIHIFHGLFVSLIRYLFIY